MIDKLLSSLAPHPCCGCNKIGTLLCADCKYNINIEKFTQCVACGGNSGRLGVCAQCCLPYSRAWCVGERSGALQRLIGKYKFQNVYAAHVTLSDLLLECLDELPSETIVVPVPTVAAHIRERGYDHMFLLARRIAKKQNLRVQQALYRVTNTKQRDATRLERIAQAEMAFKSTGKLKEGVPYLLIDDVVTTGATLQYAAEALRDAGASDIWVAAIARQPLD